MNGNELNNMAQRYKDEMMRLYRKSGANQSAADTQMGAPMPRQSSQLMQQPAAVQNNRNNMNMNRNEEQGASMHRPAAQPQNNMQAQSPASPGMARDIAGTPIPGLPGASHFAAQQPSDSGINVPVNCECRFPSAESIIAGIPVHPIIRPEDTPPAAYPCKPIQPRNDTEGNNAVNNSPRDINPNMGGTFSVQDKTAYNRSADTSLQGILLNGSPDSAEYAVPSEAEEEREILPDFPLPRDSMNSIPITAGFTPSTSWISLTGENSWGFLQFDVFTADGAYPVPGAVVIVKKQLPAGVGLVRVLFTDRSGLTPNIALPAPSAALSQNPRNTARPFSEYSVTVMARGYYTLRDIKIPIFAGIKTVQPIDLIPLPEYSEQKPIQPRSDMTDNSMTDISSVG